MTRADDGQSLVEEMWNNVVAAVPPLYGSGASGRVVVANAAAAVAAPVAAKLLVTRSELRRVDTLHEAVLAEVERRLNRGELIRHDLVDRPFHRAEEMIEGTIFKARAAYEEHKVKYLAHFLVQVLFDADQDLGEAFFQLTLAERLTYHQYLLLAFFDRVTKGELDPGDSSIPFGDEPPEELQPLLLALYDLFQIGLLRDRFSETLITMARDPRDIRLSLSGRRLARNLGLHRVEDVDVQAIWIRLNAHLPSTD